MTICLGGMGERANRTAWMDSMAGELAYTKFDMQLEHTWYILYTHVCIYAEQEL